MKTETKDQILKDISSFIDNSINILEHEINDYDNVIGDYRICINFVSYMHKLQITTFEVLNTDWDLDVRVTGELYGPVQKIVADFNQEAAESIDREYWINLEQNNYFLNI